MKQKNIQSFIEKIGIKEIFEIPNGKDYKGILYLPLVAKRI